MPLQISDISTILSDESDRNYYDLDVARKLKKLWDMKVVVIPIEVE